MRKWKLRARASLFRAAWIFAAVFYSYTCRSRTTDRKRHAQRRIASYFMRGTWGQALYTNTPGRVALVMLPSYRATLAEKEKRRGEGGQNWKRGSWKERSNDRSNDETAKGNIQLATNPDACILPLEVVLSKSMNLSIMRNQPGPLA